MTLSMPGLVIWTKRGRHGFPKISFMNTAVPSKKYLTADDAKHIALPWCAVAEFVSVENAGSEDLYLCRATFPAMEAHLFHYHPGREEIIYILEGQAEQWVGEEKRLLGPGEMALIPAGMPHMTFNPGPAPLVFLAILNNIRGAEPMVVDCFREDPWVGHFTPIEYPPAG